MSTFTTIADACDLVTDGTHYTPKDVGAGVPFLTVKDVSDSGLDFRDCSFITESDYLAAKAGNSAPMRGDVLFSKDGTVGKVHVVSTDQPFAVLSSLAILRPKAGKVDSDYLGHVLRSPAVLDAALKKKTGSAIRRIVLGDLKRVQLPLPSVDAQRRIAALLDQAETLRTQRRAALAQLDSLTQSLFLDMFGDPVANDRGWPDSLTLGEVADIASGVTKGRNLEGKVTRELPYLAVANVQDKSLRLAGIKSIDATEDEIQRYRLQKNDLLLTEGGDPDKLGRGTLWNDELPECIHQNHIFRVRLTTDLLTPLFLNWIVGSPRGKRYFLRSAKQTTGIASINMTQLRGFPLLAPPLALQQTFATRIQAIEALKTSHRTALAKLDALFASLQQRAFSGELTRPAAAVQALPAPARDFSELCRLDTGKMLEALIYVAKRMPLHDLYKSLKALYFGDKHHLEHHGAFVYGETYCALQHGPVPQAAYDLTRALESDAASDLFADDPLRATLRLVDHQLIPSRDADFGKLGAAERQSLDWAIRYCGTMSFEQTKTASHDTAYRVTPPNAPMAMEDIVRMLPQAAQRRFWS